MAYRKLLVSVALFGALSAGACNRMDDDFIVPVGHPADPQVRPGNALSGFGALDPRLRSVSPQITPSTAPRTPSKAMPSHQHGQHKHQ